MLKQARAQVSVPGAHAGRALYVAQANTINPADTTVNQHFNAIAQFDGVMRAYNRSGLRYNFRYYAEDSHGSVPLAAEYDGLRFIFQDYSVDLVQAMDRPAYLTEHFARVTDRLGMKFLPPESMVAMLASFTSQQDKDKALALFQLNATLYPGSAQVHQALGNVWRGRGDTAQAIAAYERALAIAPGRTLIRDNLAKLKKKG